MKKLINLIALVMLVSTNVLTPFSYAQEETSEVIPENEVENVEEIGETPEKDNEITGEISNSLGEVEGEGSLPLVREVVNESEPEGLKEEVENSLDAVESPAPDENKIEDTEKVEIDEVVSPVEENTENEKQEEKLEGDEVEEDSSLQKVDEPTFMQVQPGTSATLLPGQEFNATIKTLAHGGRVPYTIFDEKIQSFQRVNEIPTGVITGEISIIGAEYPVYAGFSGGILYYATESETIYMNPDSSYMFYGMDGLTGIDLSSFNTSKVTNMSYMFSRCVRLVGLDLSSFDTSNVTDMSYMFEESYDLENLNMSSFDTSRVTDMQHMFKYYKGTSLDLSNFDTSRVTNMDQIFGGCYKLENLNLSGWDFSHYSFSNYLGRGMIHNFFTSSPSQLKSINMTNAKFSGDMSYLFRDLIGLEDLKLDGVDTKNVIDMSLMFWHCEKLTGLNLESFNTSNVTNMGGMFNGCTGLEELDLSNWDTSNVENMGNMFYGCSSLTGLDLSNFDTSRVTNMDQIFGGCNKLEELNLNGWDFRKLGRFSMGTIMGGIIESFRKLNMEDAKFSGSMSYAFGGFSNLEEVNLSGADTRGVTDMGAMFNSCSNLTGLDLSNFDTSNVTNMGGMFYGCSKLEELRLDNWSFYKNPTVRDMFYGTDSLKRLSAKNREIPEIFTEKLGCRASSLCATGIESIDVSSWNLSGTKVLHGLFGGSYTKEIKGLNTWDTSNVTVMSELFSNCSNLTGLDLGGLNTEKVMTMEKMFNGCSKLENLNLDNRVINNSSSTIGGMFGGASNLKNVSMRNWTIPETFTNAIGCRNSSLCSTSLESIDVSNWDLSKTKSLLGVFGNLEAKEIKGLDTWDTSNVINMSNMFFNCNNLTGLDLSNWDTSNVTGVSQMFAACSNLEKINLNNWNTDKLESFGQIFGGCGNLEEISLSGWDFRKFNVGSLLPGQLGLGVGGPLKKLDITNTKFSGNMEYSLGGQLNLEEIKLDGIDTSNVTSMRHLFFNSFNLKSIDLSSFDTKNVTNMERMFSECRMITGLDLSSFDTKNVTNMERMFDGCSGLNELDLSSFDTKNVTRMLEMFRYTPNLKTIYASDNFIISSLTDLGGEMFYKTTSVIGGNGTKFDPNFIDKTYAKIDKVGQTGYFTDKNAITVKFISTLDGTETTSTFAKGQKLTPPYVDKYHVVGGYLDEELTQAIDLNKGVDSYTVIYVKYDHNGSSGGGGGGGSSKKTDEDTHGSAEESQKNTQDDKNTENVIQNETKGSKEASNTPVDSSDKSSEGQEILSPSDSSFTKEQKDAYTFAKENGITTKDTIQSAQMNGKLTRIAMAKMLSQYAINVLGQTPDTSKTIKFRDVTSKKDADYDNGVTLAYQLGIMGQNMPGNNFRPNDEVTRAEFATALSRMAYNTSDGEYKSTSKYYIHHMEKLVKEGIITNDNPNMKELRGYVMIMLMRSAK